MLESRKSSAVGGPMLNPSVEPSSRRESTGTHRGSASSRRGTGFDVPNGDSSLDPGTLALALENRNKRRSITLKRFGVTDHMREALIEAVDAVARETDLSATEGQSSLEKLQNIMTKAKEKGIGVSKLFQYFLVHDNSDNGTAEETTQANEDHAALPAAPDQPTHHTVHENVDITENKLSPDKQQAQRASLHLRQTENSKRRSETKKRDSKSKKMDLMPSLQKRTEKAGKRPSSSSSGRGLRKGSGSHRQSDYAQVAPDGVPPGPPRKSHSRSSMQEEMETMKIDCQTFEKGLVHLGFRMPPEESKEIFSLVDSDHDGAIDLTEFTRFCLEIPSVTWKAERARRGVLSGNNGSDFDREIEKAAQDMANEVMRPTSPRPAYSAKEEEISLGKVVFKGEKFFWRTQDLIEVVIQLNATEGFMAISTFNTDLLITYPVIFVDPAKIPVPEQALSERIKALEKKEDHSRDPNVGSGAGNDSGSAEALEAQSERIHEEAHIAYISDYLLTRLCMPDMYGNLLQPDLLQPGVPVNPDIHPEQSTGEGNDAEMVRNTVNEEVEEQSKAERRPGIMRTTFDKWDTLLYSDPPSASNGHPDFSKTQKRHSYYEQFVLKESEFRTNRINAHRLSNEADALSTEVALLMKKLAPLGYSPSAPAILEDVKPTPTSGRVKLEGLPSGEGSDNPTGEDRNSKSSARELIMSQSEPQLSPQSEPA